MKYGRKSQYTAEIITTYVNKTQSVIDGLKVQVAVMKHSKLTINLLNSMIVQPLPKEVVKQADFYLLKTMTVVNSAVGQKRIVMKVKISN